MLRRFAMWMLSAGTVVLVSNSASSQSYPYKPIRVVTAEVGGAFARQPNTRAAVRDRPDE